MGKILDSWWYNTCDGKCIGIVKYKNEDGETKFRIGVVGGLDQNKDEWFIMEYGDRFIPEIVK